MNINDLIAEVMKGESREYHCALCGRDFYTAAVRNQHAISCSGPKPAGDTGRHVEPTRSPLVLESQADWDFWHEQAMKRAWKVLFDALEARAWPDYDAILLAARKRRGAENNYLEEPSARDLHEPIDGRNLFRALSVPDPHDQSVHERLMPWRGRG